MEGGVGKVEPSTLKHDGVHTGDLLRKPQVLRGQMYRLTERVGPAVPCLASGAGRLER